MVGVPGVRRGRGGLLTWSGAADRQCCRRLHRRQGSDGLARQADRNRARRHHRARAARPIVGFVIGHLYDAARARDTGARDAGARSGERGRRGARRGPAGRVLPGRLRGDGPRREGRRARDAGGDRAARDAMRRFSLGEAEVQRAIDCFTQGKSPDYPLEEVLAACGGERRARGLRRLFVQIQLEAALRGGGLGAPRARVRAHVQRARHHGDRVRALERCCACGALRRGRCHPQRRRRLADAYQVLGWSPARRCGGDARLPPLVSQNHPTSWSPTGCAVHGRAAHERTRRILEAYEIIRKHRG